MTRSTRALRAIPTASDHDSGVLVAFDDVGLDFAAKRIINRLSFSIAPGEIVSVVGPSGCGKTTLLRLVTGLLQPTRGAVRRDGIPIKGPAGDVAIVFQDYANALLPWRTVAGNVSLALEAGSLTPSQRKMRIEDLLGKVSLRAHANKYPRQLSGGMQQRLQIARCLAQEPTLLLMDEPFGALDAMTRQTLQDEMLRLVRETRTTVLFITHDLEEAIYLSDKIIALRANPGEGSSLARTFAVDLPRPRDQLSTREEPEFLRLRRQAFDYLLEPHV